MRQVNKEPQTRIRELLSWYFTYLLKISP